MQERYPITANRTALEGFLQVRDRRYTEFFDSHCIDYIDVIVIVISRTTSKIIALHQMRSQELYSASESTLKKIVYAAEESEDEVSEGDSSDLLGDGPTTPLRRKGLLN